MRCEGVGHKGMKTQRMSHLPNSIRIVSGGKASKLCGEAKGIILMKPI